MAGRAKKKNPAELVLMGGNPSRRRNPAELVLIGLGGNPMRSPYDSLSRDEKLAFGRLGLGKKHLRSQSDIDRARTQVKTVNRFRNRLPNPAIGETGVARELAADFKHAPSDRYTVMNEPRVPAGDYARLGCFVAIGVKPDRGGQVLELSFEDVKSLTLISDANGRQLFIVGGDQNLSRQDLEQFTGSPDGHLVLLGQGRWIVYGATKWHPQIDDAHRGKPLTYQHEFGEEGGRKPEIWYDASVKRLLLRGGDYTVEGVGIKN